MESQTYEELIRNGLQMGGDSVTIPVLLFYQMLVAIILMNLIAGIVLSSLEESAAEHRYESLHERFDQLLLE